jgi:hypothetical protein
METVLAKVLEVLAEDVVTAVREHESYKQLVASLAQQAIVTAAQPAGPTSAG